MADDIAQWLEGLGLGQYAEEFAENRIDLDILPSLSDDDLRELGLKLGDRRRIQRALEPPSSDDNEPAASKPNKELATSSVEAERRQLTVMFCDLVGSTALSSQLDPEDLREVIRSYQDACAGVVARYEGFVAKYMGDGVLVYFGYPTAHEDDVERSINAGIGIVDAVGALKQDLQVRIGIATGMVVVGDLIGEGASQEAAITGETPNLAARLQELAEPNRVVIAETTHALAGGLFEFDNQGIRHLKGFAEPIQVWSVAGSSRAESRFDATRAEGLTELVGRDEEMEILLRRWHRAKSGEGQVVLIAGEPGIGKSRLARELQDQLANEPLYRLHHQCSPFHSNSALFPITERLGRAAGFEAGDDAVIKLEKLEALLDLSDEPITNIAPLFASLLSIPTGERYPPLNLTPQRQKELTLQALIAQIVGLAARQPILFVLEDAHWIDPMTLELMDLLVERAPEAAVLVLITYRPEFDAPWLGRARVTPMHLGRLEPRDCVMLVQRVASQVDLPDALRDRIADQTDGVPLFVEELTKSVMETAQGPSDSTMTIEVPATLRDSLEARLDRLGPAKEVAQIGAVVGRSFDFELLTHVSDINDAELRDALDRLVQSELVFRRGEPPDATFTFKHALIQDTAYGSLLRSRRGELHGIIANVLEKNYPEIVSAQPVLLAHHLASANRAAEAIEYYIEAGRQASQRWSSAEAIRHLQDGLSLLDAVDDQDRRSRLELRLQMTLGPAMMMVKGWGSSEAEEPYSRASELSARVGNPREHFTALWGLWMIHEQRRERVRAQEFIDTLSDLAARENDAGLKVQACHAAWGNPWRGNFREQMGHIERGLELYDPKQHGGQAPQFGGHDAGVCGLGQGANALWALGYPERSMSYSRRARALADEIGHLPTVAHSWQFSAWLNSYAGNWEEVRRCAEKCIELGREQALPRWVLQGLPIRGLALAVLGHAEEGLADIRHAMEIYRSQKTRASSATNHVFLVHAHTLSGPPEEGIELADEAIRHVELSGERTHEANIHRLKGELLLKLSRTDEAEGCFETAIAIARGQDAKMWELRAAVRLAELWHAQGKIIEARDLLAPIYDWFTEGFETADLKHAKALLAELN